MHYEVKGQGRGYDPAEDILNASKIDDYINQTILPLVQEEAFKSKNIFGELVTPQNVSNKLVEGLKTLDKEQVRSVLKELDMEDFEGTPEELKNYIESSFRTDSATEIRKKIEELNKIRERPSQRALGFEYIERPEDYKPASRGSVAQTALYKTFKTSGYPGTEDDFYNIFFTDLDREEQKALTQENKTTTGGSLFDSLFKTSGEQASPFVKPIESPIKTKSSYFKLKDESADEDGPGFLGGSSQNFLNSFLSF